MKRAVVIFLLLISASITKLYSQHCGRGTVTLNIFTINGTDLKDVSFQIFPVSKDLIDKYVDSDSWNSGRIISDFSEKELIPSEESTSKLNMFLKLSSLPQSGKFTTSLKLTSIETAYFPVVLKISIDGKTTYLLGNYFGGCDREACLIWNGTFFRLI